MLDFAIRRCLGLFLCNYDYEFVVSTHTHMSFQRRGREGEREGKEGRGGCKSEGKWRELGFEK